SLIYCLAFSPDGACLVSGGRDHQIKVWDTASGRERRRLPDLESPGNPWPGRVYAVCYDATGRMIASVDHVLRVSRWDATNLGWAASDSLSPEKEIAPPHEESLWMQGASFSPNGQSLVLWGHRGEEESKHWWLATWDVPWKLAMEHHTKAE